MARRMDEFRPLFMARRILPYLVLPQLVRPKEWQSPSKC